MHYIIILSICLMLALFGTGIFATRSPTRLRRITASNASPRAVLRHQRITRALDATVTSLYLLAKQGASDDTIAVCGATDRPVGVMDDTGAEGESIAMRLFGVADETLLMVASAAISAGDLLYTAASGTVTNVSSAGAFCVGRAMIDAAEDGIVEVDPQTPVVVPEAAPPAMTASHYVFAAGTHTWAGGADTTDSIAIAGLLATDVILVTSATGPAVVSAVKGSGAAIDVTLATAGTDGTTKLNYGVLRANA
jgi:hypothetical protein